MRHHEGSDEMNTALIGYMIIVLIFGGIFIFVARLEGFLVALGIFAGSISITVLLVIAEHLIKME
jgi:hypothetical protein